MTLKIQNDFYNQFGDLLMIIICLLSANFLKFWFKSNPSFPQLYGFPQLRSSSLLSALDIFEFIPYILEPLILHKSVQSSSWDTKLWKVRDNRSFTDHKRKRRHGCWGKIVKMCCDLLEISVEFSIFGSIIWRHERSGSLKLKYIYGRACGIIF